MRTHDARGFTLIEVMVAATLAAALAAAAFAAIAVVQNIAGTTARAASMGAEGRAALDIMGRDIRNAGDSLQAGVGNCLGAPGLIQLNQDGIAQCPAILEPHPWRVIVARYASQDGDGDFSTFGFNDPPRNMVNATLNDSGHNMVAYEFVPDPGPGVPQNVTDRSAPPGQARQAWFGRIERIQNPFQWPNFPAVGQNLTIRTVLVDNVVLDDAMIVDPVANPPVPNLDVAFSLFSYRVAYRPGELALGGPETSLTQTLISPPMRFFAPTLANQPRTFATINGNKFGAGLPFAGIDYAPDIAGFAPFDGANEAFLLSPAASSGVLADLGDPTSDLRYLIDRNRFRMVQVTFRVHEGRDPATGLPLEDPSFHVGLDIDNNPANGTAHVVSFQATISIKSLETNALQYEQGGAL